MIYQDTIAAISTPPGNGGIGIIRISGPDAYDVATQVFVPVDPNKTLKKMRGYSALFGSFSFEGRVIDEGIALCFKSPHSYTGEDLIELNCHGSEVICRQLLLAVYQAGARPAAPGEFTKRAYLNEKMSLTQAEAVMDIITASSRQGAATARLALNGKLNEKINKIKNKLLKYAAHLAAWVDYPEEDVDVFEMDELLAILDQVESELDEMVREYDRGSAIKRGIRAAIVGSPNVGKSTLFNLLSGINRSIVTNIAGTTRDVIKEEIHIGGIPFFISDTAGLRQAKDEVEQEGIRRSQDEIDKATLVIAVFDGSAPLSKQDLALAAQCENLQSIAIINKSDLGLKAEPKALEAHFQSILVLSAHEEKSRDIIEDEVLRAAHLSREQEDQPMLMNERQLASATAAREAVKSLKTSIQQEKALDIAGVFLDEAMAALAALNGENASDVIIEEVFSKFCVGK